MVKKAKTQIIYRRVSELEKLGGNPRYIKDDDMAKLIQSVKDNPDYFECRPIILSNRTGQLVIIAGNMRYEAAKRIGLEEVPTVLLEGLSENREKEIVIRDNVSNGRWDWDVLANGWDVQELQDWGVECSFLGESEDSSPVDDIVLEEPTNLDDTEARNKPFVVKMTFKNEETLRSFEEKYKSLILDEFDCTMSVSGGEL